MNLIDSRVADGIFCIEKDGKKTKNHTFNNAFDTIINRPSCHARFRPMKKHTAISPSLKILNHSVPFPEFCSTHTVRIAQHKSKLNYSLNTVQ